MVDTDGGTVLNAWRHQPLTIRLLAVSAGVLTAAAAFAAPADADAIDDKFITALNDAGVNYGDPGNAVALGQAVCPMLAQPGGSFNAAVSTVVARTSGMSKPMAAAFTSIAISTYCPQVLSGAANGDLSALQQIPGVPAF
ncbi:hypothetical protein MB901379_01040 [Mycobacterium basiliense]|uniref:DUF732 domain-containing protein n=1 Tax=Mycobacterium basiliense TaxID=2094119 RepID=A0A3S4BTU0_9MYCO|nr:DUF732 domain-containing protein [Mycobacterium basiliense]VDM87498.1 hypothetical protein MB901379_01040 [Mycobacterium basiliense]